jgi:carbon-monoxide dehydrogenase medium subunit
MGIPDFDYYEPTSLEEAVSLRSRYRGESRILAGGTDLLVRMRNGVMAPKCVINVGKIARLTGIMNKADGSVSIGAGTTIRTLELSPIIRSNYAPLAEASSRLGSTQIRNVATLGGNLCNAAPSADCAPPLLLFDTLLSIVGPSGSRQEPVGNFFTGPGSTTLGDDEILAEVHLSALKGRWSGTYMKHSRRREMDLAVVGVAVLVAMNPEKGICSDSRIALGAVAPTPIRASRAEKMLAGQRPTRDLIEEASHVASDETRPITDVRATAEYRKVITEVNVRRALDHCFNQLGVSL